MNWSRKEYPEHRPQYNNLKSKLRKHDILIITDIDRLGRSADDVIMEFKKLKADSIRVIVLDSLYINEWEKIQDKYDSWYIYHS